MDFLRIAQGVNPLPVLHWMFHSEERDMRDDEGPKAGWFECTLGRLFVLDLMRQVEGVALGAVRVVELEAGASEQINSPEGMRTYLGVLEGSLTLQRESDKAVAEGEVWACGPYPFRVQGPGKFIVIQIGMDI